VHPLLDDERPTVRMTTGERDRPSHARQQSTLGWKLRQTVAVLFPLTLTLLLLAHAAARQVPPDAAHREAAAPAATRDATQRLLQLVNAERAKAHLAPLTVLPSLQRVAAVHSAAMAADRRLDRVRNLAGAAGQVGMWGANVACGPTAEQAHRTMMRSATQQGNILGSRYNGIGLGAAWRGSCLWITELFVKVPASTLATQHPAAARPGAVRPPAPTSSSTSPSSSSTTTAPATTAAPATTTGSVAQRIAKDLFSRLNAERARRGLPSLAWDASLASMALGWSTHMAQTGSFAHRDLSAARSLPGISRFSALGENIAFVEGFPNDAYQLHIGWMKSEGHRENLLQPGFDSVGIGVVCSGGRAWATQNFGHTAGSSTPDLSSAVPPQDPIVAVQLDGLRCG
jgi:uncharacterized protein YkwD